jgi:signal transduction histidine kinase
MMRRALGIAAAVGAAAGISAIAWPVYGGHAFVSAFEILGPLGAVTAMLADLIAHHRVWVRGVRGQLGVLAALVATQLGVAVALFASLMFVSKHDALFMALAAGYAGLIGLGAARLVASGALSDLDAIRQAVHDVGEGSREVDIPIRGPGELATLAADLQAMVDKLAAAERARRQLVASVSHDLRTPLTNLRLIADGLEDDIFEPERTREELRLISTHVRALGSLIDDLFELSRIEAGDIRWSIEQVRLDELVRDTIEAMRPQADAGGVTIRTELDRVLEPARGNPEQLQRVLFNLIQNAIRHTPPDGSVVVRAGPVPGPGVEVEVADSGAGIEPGLRERIFEPFVQGPSRVAGANGASGLGLAIARAIVQAHGGRIWVADDGPGTRVCFTLPAGRGRVAA